MVEFDGQNSYDSGDPEQGGYSGRNNNNNSNNSGSDNNSGNNGQGGKNNNGMPPKKQSLMFLVIAVLLTLISMSLFMNFFSSDASQEITYDEFIQKLEAGEIGKVEIQSDQLLIIPKSEMSEAQTQSDAFQDLYTPALNMLIPESLSL